MCTNIDSLMNQPYHNNNIDDHIVNNNANAPLPDPGWITSPGPLDCCNIAIKTSHYFHVSAKAASS